MPLSYLPLSFRTPVLSQRQALHRMCSLRYIVRRGLNHTYVFGGNNRHLFCTFFFSNCSMNERYIEGRGNNHNGSVLNLLAKQQIAKWSRKIANCKTKSHSCKMEAPSGRFFAKQQNDKMSPCKMAKRASRLGYVSPSMFEDPISDSSDFVGDYSELQLFSFCTEVSLSPPLQL